ncbi:MAG: hypothetical protein RJA99_3185 [Pseudomonadota bacterium]|jgi:hypothetical protein
MSPPYDGPERRTEAITEDRVKLLIQAAVQQALTTHEQHLTAHMDKQFLQLKLTFAEAFPNGDPHGHRVAHEKAIASANWWDKVKSDAFAKTASMGLWAALAFLCVAAWEHFKSGMKG